MKIIKCKECGEQIPSNVAFCHNCGYPIKTKRKFKNAAIRIGTVLLLCIDAILLFYFGRNTKNNNQFANNSISKDSVMQPFATKQKKVKVDLSLVRTGGHDYYASEEENGREIIGGITLAYNVDSTQNCQGTLSYYPNKADYVTVSANRYHCSA